jgi:hypothetical protein
VDIVSYALAKKAERIAIGAVSGIDSIAFVDTQLVIKFIDGSSAALDVPLPSDGASITNVVINDYNHLICTLSNGQTIDAGEITGGSGGTTDYNKLLNIPITNLTGTEDNPIILSGLNYGNYLITGYYQYTSRTDIRLVDYKMLVEILQDLVSLRKVAKFQVYEDSKPYLYSIFINEDESCLVDKVLIANQKESIIFIKEADLPTFGQEKILYITEDSILKWDGSNYISMGGPQWGSF